MSAPKETTLIDRPGHSTDDPWTCYLLPDTVEANLHRHRTLGEVGVHEWARGTLIELCRVLDAEPLAVHYDEPVHPDTRVMVASIVTATVGHHDRQVITTLTRIPGDRDAWDLVVDDVPIAHGDEPLPTKRDIARMVREHLRTCARDAAIVNTLALDHHPATARG